MPVGLAPIATAPIATGQRLLDDRQLAAPTPVAEIEHLAASAGRIGVILKPRD
jgi:hypothetical protein